MKRTKIGNAADQRDSTGYFHDMEEEQIRSNFLVE